jgi:hypothetical protein
MFRLLTLTCFSARQFQYESRAAKACRCASPMSSAIAIEAAITKLAASARIRFPRFSQVPLFPSFSLTTRLYKSGSLSECDLSVVQLLIRAIRAPEVTGVERSAAADYTAKSIGPLIERGAL